FNRIGNLIVIKAKVDTLEGNFILDTGAPYLVLNLTYFRDYPVTTIADGEQTSIAGRGAMLSRTSIKELSFGPLQFIRLDADLANLGNIENAKGIKVLGLLGVELFKTCQMVIDFEKSLIYLHRVQKKEAGNCVQDHLKDTSLYRTFSIEYINNRIVIPSEIAGKKIRLIIDCAAESNILDSRLPNRIFELVTVNRIVKLTGPGERKIDALYGSLSQLKLGSREINNLPVLVLNLEYTCFAEGNCGDGVLGFDFLSQQKIGFNFVTRKMYIWK
ncbi:MAG TPA: retropepsin-like aspartic protease, partial [Flavisolibacter sp.]|nr:retropepsin-like aspartic protease [Flavisolibacter sp.]